MITFEGFSVPLAGQQAEEIVAVVEAEAGWLAIARPDTLRRYPNPLAGAEVIRHLMRSSLVAPEIIRREKAMIGLATIVRRFGVASPENSREVYSGRQIDYWTIPDVTPEEHEEITHGLMRKNGYGGQVLATLTADEQERALGIPRLMTAIGKPALLHVPRNYNDLGLNSLGVPAQLYVASVRQE